MMYTCRDHARMLLFRRRLAAYMREICVKAKQDLPVDQTGLEQFGRMVEWAIVEAAGDYSGPVVNAHQSVSNGFHVTIWVDKKDPMYDLWEAACPYAVA